MSTLSVTLTGIAPATLTLELGTPGPQGSTGPAGPTGATGSQGIPGVGVPAGGASGQYLQKTSGADYATDWVTVNLAAYAVKANNLSDLTNFTTARANLGLGTMATATAADYSTTTVASGLYAPIAAGLPTGGTAGQVLTKNSGTNYDDSWQTLIPGDRYLTSSTTSLTINNANKTLTIGTGLSYTPTQNITISYNASNHMHGEVLTYDSGTGVLTVDINNHTGSGTYAAWVVNVGGVTPATSVAWGAITGVIGNQADLSGALSAKLEVSTAASTYQTLSGMSSYLTTASAASTYQTQSGMSDYLSKAGNLAGLTNTGTARTNLALGTIATVNDAPSNGSTYGRNNGAWVVAGGFTGGAITSPITYDNGSGYISTFASNLIGINEGASSVPFKNANFNENRFYLFDVYVGAVGDEEVTAQFNLTGITGSKTGPSNYTFSTGSGGAVYSGSNYSVPSSFSYTRNGVSFQAEGQATACSFTPSGITFQDGTTQTTSASIPSGLATESWVTSNFYPLSGNPSGFVDSSYVSSNAYPLSGNPSGFMTSPGSGNYVWYSGAWYSASVASVYDNNTSSYVNVLSI